MPGKHKVFGIGLNKTGTSTLGLCLQQLGYHHTSYVGSLMSEYRKGRISDILKATEAFESFEDWPWPLVYKELYWRYGPDAKFILTTRASPEVWLESLKRHSLNTHPTAALRQFAYGYMYPHGYEKEHIDIYVGHNQAVRDFFAREAPEQLMEVCWEAGDRWEKICGFLGKPVPSAEFPHIRPREQGAAPAIREQNAKNIREQLERLAGQRTAPNEPSRAAGALVQPARQMPSAGGEKPRRAAIYFAWGEKYVKEAARSAASAARLKLPRILLTDGETPVPTDSPFEIVKRVELPNRSLEAKSALYSYLPDAFDSFLFLDTDTFVLGDVALGFEKAEAWGLAVSMAPHYSLSDFWGFGRVMEHVGIRRMGQVQYNTSVMFLSRRDDVDRLFRRWAELTSSLSAVYGRKTDQPYFTLAMELEGFNPYVLSPSYNYRGAGEIVSGDVRIWHSRHPLPKDVNEYKNIWPPRRFIGARRVEPAGL